MYRDRRMGVAVAVRFRDFDMFEMLVKFAQPVKMPQVHRRRVNISSSNSAVVVC